MEDAKNSTMVVDMLGFLAMQSAISLPPGFAPKGRCGGLGLEKAMLPWGCMLEDAWVEQPFPNFLLP